MSHSTEESVRPAATPIRVLVVDDDRGARALHSGFVAETPGFSLAGTASTGEAALAQSMNGVDLILLDMRLPDISGVEVLHRLRTLGARVPDVLVISSSRDQTTVRQALAAHVVGYLIKPFTQAALQERLDLYSAERRASSESDRERPLAQGEIDRLLATGSIRQHASPRSHSSAGRTGAPPPASLPKGLAQVTLERVVAALDPVIPATALDVAEACDISRATARRYLDHLVETGVIDLAHRYGKRGRPQVLYRLSPSPER
ncbi:response regulator [Pseudoclavibacter terrae]|uniref:Response regulator n=1 Tax=Pseudoclavibacter terrae TaxID=1530195 RepID=A0A7J5B2C6_9MICO|nr:response regulator [Pseudoclavibacter terrae]KAB1638121.1 response regulator [Pseudoclavibacter terrae]